MMEEVFGQVLKDLMREKGVDIHNLCELLNVKYSTVSMWKNGKVIPLAKTLAVLADYFNVSVDYLLGRTDNLFVQIGNAEMHMSAEQKERFLKLERLNKKALQELDGYIDYKLSLQEE